MKGPTRALTRARRWARAVKTDIVALHLAARDPRVPLSAKLVAGLVAAYALSPVDLIPDFIPVLGYLDDLLLVPLGILLAVRLIPPPVMNDLRRKAAALQERPASRMAAMAIVTLWIVAVLALGWTFWPRARF
ncbi:YkvA family protein [Microvirga thermotolerans]|nr:DUF1232 domain-containing protein [Microvirga thermotolerans]